MVMMTNEALFDSIFFLIKVWVHWTFYTSNFCSCNVSFSISFKDLKYLGFNLLLLRAFNPPPAFFYPKYCLVFFFHHRESLFWNNFCFSPEWYKEYNEFFTPEQALRDEVKLIISDYDERKEREKQAVKKAAVKNAADKDGWITVVSK